MIKFTDEFIKEASYLYQLAEKVSDLSINYLDKLEDKLFIERLNDIFKSTFNRIVHYLRDAKSTNIPSVFSCKTYI